MELEIDGLKVSYTVSGSGEDVLLLHGWGVDSSVMEPLRSRISEYARAISLDFPGFGGSQPPAEVWGVRDYADFVEKFIQALGLQQPMLLGHSFGGRVAIVLGSRGVGHKLMLTDAAGIKPRRSLKYYLRTYSYKAAKKIFSLPGLRKFRDRALALWLKNNPSSDYSKAQGIMRKIFVRVVNEDLTDLLPSIAAPTLLLWGEIDTATPLRDGRLMEKKIPDAGLVLFEGCGHYPFLEQPGKFYAAVEYFIRH